MTHASKAPEPPTGFLMRRYVPADWADYLDLDVTNRMEERGLEPSEKEHFMKLRLLRLNRVYRFTPHAPPSNPPHQIFVLRRDSGDYAGHLWMTDGSDPLTNEEMVHVTSVAVAAQFRRHGLGRYLLRLLEVLARLREVPELRVDVGVDNHAAIRFFAEVGFEARAQRMVKTLAHSRSHAVRRKH